MHDDKLIKIRLKSIILWFVFLASLFALILFQFLRPHLLSDLIVSARFQPSSDVLELQTELELTNEANRIYLASQPELNTAEAFNQNCVRKEASVTILGCYANYQIFVYDIQNSELDGIRQTTMAHELLHAVYDRLSSNQKQQITIAIEADYERLKTDELEERLEFYRRTEPNQIINELHSILGTEMIDLSPELEAHYGRFFNDRELIVAAYNQYHKKFTELYNQSEEIKIKIDQLEPKISDAKMQYDQELSQLNYDIELFNQLARNGQMTRTEFYNQKWALNNRISNLDVLRQSINQDVSYYNQLIQEYNNNASRYNQLTSSLDSIDPGPSL